MDPVDSQTPGDGLRRRLLIARDHTDRQSHCTQCRNHFGSPVSRPVRDPQNTLNHAIDRDTDGGLRRRCDGLQRGREVAGFAIQLRHVSRRTHGNLGTADHAADAQPDCHLNVACHGPRQATRLRRTHHCLGDRVFAHRLDGGGPAQQRRVTAARLQRGHLRAPFGERAGLIEQHQIHFGQQIQCTAATKQDPEIAPAPRCHQDGCRRGQTHGAGTGDEQHAHGRGEGVAERRIRSDQQPDHKGECRKCQHNGHEHPGDTVGELLDRRFVGLRLGDHSDNPRQRRIGANPHGRHGQGPIPVDGSADQLSAHVLGHRNWLPGHHGFIDVAAAVHNDGIGGNAFPGANQQPVARTHRVDADLLPVTGCPSTGSRGLQAKQFGDGHGRPTASARLHATPEDDERDDDSRSLEIGRC